MHLHIYNRDLKTTHFLDSLICCLWKGKRDKWEISALCVLVLQEALLSEILLISLGLFIPQVESLDI